MDNHYIVTKLREDEIPIAIDWAKNEGWNPGLHDATCFYQADPNGFFAGKLDGKIIAVGSAVIYDDEFAFCGFYMVDPKYRGRGYGLALTNARLEYIGHRNVGLDGVVSMLDKYQRIGYQSAYHNARYCGEHVLVAEVADPLIFPLEETNFAWLMEYDRRHFPAQRDKFLRCWIHQENAVGYAYVKGGDILGYGVIRECYDGFKIAPLFADTPEIAHALFAQLIPYAKNNLVYLDIPECNADAVRLVKHYHMNKVFETARMYLKQPPNIFLEHIYGITSFELG